MLAATTTQPRADGLVTGRKFAQRPGERWINAFLQHNWRTGSPHTWTPLTTTPYPPGDPPIILTRFSIPQRLRSGRETRAPCSICSPHGPKFDEGMLVYCSDLRVRIIGHECGHQFFGESFSGAVQEHDLEVAEKEARQFLLVQTPRMGRVLTKASMVTRNLHQLLDFHERLVARITKRAVKEMRRARQGDQLTVTMDGNARDERGRKVIQVVTASEVSGLDCLIPPDRTFHNLYTGIMEADKAWLPCRSDIEWGVGQLSRNEVIQAALTFRRLDASLSKAEEVLAKLQTLLSPLGLSGLSAWGRHPHSPAPFWIEVTPDRRVYAGKGLRPQRWETGPFMQLPQPPVYERLSLE